jgi:DNA-binding transcriptional LysR family regulator
MERSGRSSLVWREPLVWAAADTFDLVPGAVLPLALYRERSVSREAALAALNDSDLTWEIVYTSPSLTGVRAAALAGLVVTPLPASAVLAGYEFRDWRRGCRFFLTLSSRSMRRSGLKRLRLRSPQRYWRLDNHQRARQSRTICSNPSLRVRNATSR